MKNHVNGEMAELVAWLRETGDTIQPSHLAEHQRYKRAAELLQRRQVLVPVPVAERPWERDGWCDELGRCWWGTPCFVNSYTVAQSAQWRLSTPDDRFGSELLCLPAHALPLPEVGE